jgi:ribosomal protein S16
VDLKYERIAYWRGVGAQFSSIVEKLVTKNPAPAPVAETAAA